MAKLPAAALGRFGSLNCPTLDSGNLICVRFQLVLYVMVLLLAGVLEMALMMVLRCCVGVLCVTSLAWLTVLLILKDLKVAPEHGLLLMMS